MNAASIANEEPTDWDAYQATEPGFGYLYEDYAHCPFFSISHDGSVLVDDHGTPQDARELIESIGALTLIRAN